MNFCASWRRGLRGVKLIVSDAHEGLKAAAAKVLGAGWQRCRVHFMRNALAHAHKNGRRVVSAFIATAFAQTTPEAARKQWRNVADQLRAKSPSSQPSSTRPRSTCSPSWTSPGSIGTKSARRMRSTSGFCADVLFSGCASDLEAKRGASAASAARWPIRSLPD